ncbi:MerR family transcriptional regulator [Flammeovirga sp. SJP92]|uniref:MerR family transcriptional regulator n=1 Tax=Flammeovirga sp. SJP92 TaxID=1775430 RepID=UPI0007869CCB|nr:MerR family transcriptional regulator [Flammeovirga sp. SJP92]KXX70146.1 MerR family transcriptional regulator [Flammeovirga sp. SJP92]
MSTYTIKDLEHLTGIKAHTLRIWEQRYKIIIPKRSDTNIRYYNDDDLKLMLNVSLLNSHGIKISKIAKLTQEQIREEVFNVLNTSDNYSDQITQLTTSMLNFDEFQFEKIISSSILKYSFEESMINIILPFLTRIGFLWQIGAISPAQEHFISHLVRQKIIVALDAIVLRDDKDKPRFTLFLPEGELHEITLLFASYIIKSRGFKVTYLGQSLPMQELKEVYKTTPSEYMLTVSTSLLKIGNLQDYILQLGKEFPDTKILLTGRQVIGMDYELTENAELLPSLPGFIQMIEGLAQKYLLSDTNA